jgi:hypothetical protein
MRMITSRRMRWARHIACMGRRGIHTGFWWESQKEIDHHEYPDVGSGDNIKMDLKVIEWGVMDWIDLLRIGTSGGLYSTR